MTGHKSSTTATTSSQTAFAAFLAALSLALCGGDSGWRVSTRLDNLENEHFAMTQAKEMRYLKAEFLVKSMMGASSALGTLRFLRLASSSI